MKRIPCPSFGRMSITLGAAHSRRLPKEAGGCRGSWSALFRNLFDQKGERCRGNRLAGNTIGVASSAR